MADVVVITGASSGIGRATAHRFARTGRPLALIARGTEALDATRREIAALGIQALAFPLDMADDAAVEACMKDQAQLDKLKADMQFAQDPLRVEVTPTFFVNGEMLKGSMTFEDLDKKLAPLVKR